MQTRVLFVYLDMSVGEVGGQQDNENSSLTRSRNTESFKRTDRWS